VAPDREGRPRRNPRITVEPTQALSFVMSQKMLRGIRDRAERTAGSIPPHPLNSIRS
jgi:hypothetical protein